MTAKTKRARTVKPEGYSQTLYPFETLKVGESFIVKDVSKWGSLRSLASRRGSALGRKFKVESANGQLRITRLTDPT